MADKKPFANYDGTLHEVQDGDNIPTEVLPAVITKTVEGNTFTVYAGDDVAAIQVGSYNEDGDEIASVFQTDPAGKNSQFETYVHTDLASASASFGLTEGYSSITQSYQMPENDQATLIHTVSADSVTSISSVSGLDLQVGTTTSTDSGGAKFQAGYTSADVAASAESIAIDNEAAIGVTFSEYASSIVAEATLGTSTSEAAGFFTFNSEISQTSSAFTVSADLSSITGDYITDNLAHEYGMSSGQGIARINTGSHVDEAKEYGSTSELQTTSSTGIAEFNLSLNADVSETSKTAGAQIQGQATETESSIGLQLEADEINIQFDGAVSVEGIDETGVDPAIFTAGNAPDTISPQKWLKVSIGGTAGWLPWFSTGTPTGEAGGAAGYPKHILTADMTVAAGESYVVVGPLDFNGFVMNVEGRVAIL